MKIKWLCFAVVQKWRGKGDTKKAAEAPADRVRIPGQQEQQSNQYSPLVAMALRAFSCNPSLGGFGSENVAASAGRRRHRQEGQPPSQQDPTAGDVRRTPRSIGSDGKGDGASQDRRRECTGANQGRAADGNGGGGGDAMAQILKELVDNAVDACCATKSNRPEHDDGTGGAGKDEPISLKRVRVIIEPVVGDRTGDDADDASASARKELLRVSVNDNGIGMGSIEDCVEAFRTSKRSDGSGNGNAIGDSSQSSIDPGSMGGSAPQDGTSVQSQLHPRPSASILPPILPGSMLL